MNLIECIANYSYLFKKYGKESADNFLNSAVEPEIIKHIKDSFNEDGRLIDILGNNFNCKIVDGIFKYEKSN